MIVKGTVIGLSGVKTIDKEEKKMRIQSACVDIPRKGVDGVNALTLTLFNDDCESVQIGEEVLCETDRFCQELHSIVSLSSIL